MTSYYQVKAHVWWVGHIIMYIKEKLVLLISHPQFPDGLDLLTYLIWTALCTQGDAWKDAVSLMEEMRLNGYVPTLLVLSSLIAA